MEIAGTAFTTVYVLLGGWTKSNPQKSTIRKKLSTTLSICDCKANIYGNIFQHIFDILQPGRRPSCSAFVCHRRAHFHLVYHFYSLMQFSLYSWWRLTQFITRPLVNFNILAKFTHWLNVLRFKNLLKKTQTLLVYFQFIEFSDLERKENINDNLA